MKIPTIVLAVVALVVGMSSGAVAAKLITGADIKDGSVTSADIKNGTLVTKDLKKGGVSADRLKSKSIGAGKLAVGSVTSGKIKDGSVEAKDLSAGAKKSLQTYSGPNWGIIDRNLIGNGDAFLRAGPISAFASPAAGARQNPPLGVGSLGIRTGSGTDKAAFGDQVDLQGQDVSSITTIDYWVYTTGENIQAGNGAVNLPSVEFELNPNLGAHPTDVYSSAVFVPPASANLPGWNDIDAATTGEWYLTGNTGTDVGCDQISTCSWAELVSSLDDGGDAASLFTVEISKGRDFAYSGAVDALRLNDDLYDFEPLGVFVTHP